MHKEYHNTLIIGTGCAGYACAYHLARLGVRDTLIVCENKNYGTSRNTGSDKQTYYKLSLCGRDGDSVYKMAEDLYSFGGVNGENALCEAAGSIECFFGLVMLGVPFPKNEYGEYVGYKTDHDKCSRATSAGPLTSKYMTEALEMAVENQKTEVRDGLIPVKIIKSGNTAAGCLFVDKDNEFHAIYCSNLVFATGGEASLFGESVYPKSQFGAMGVLADAGVEISNFNHWQFGIASTGFRWNLSGSFQQVIPRYISVDSDGNRSEFLREHLTDEEIFELTFLKGYEWPFDSGKRERSSYIDILIKNETDSGREVYLDFTEDPTGFDINKLTKTAYEYLENSGAFGKTPVERLKKMNIRAYDVYYNNGIDPEKEPVKIAVCAQHQNGGAKVDVNYETNIKNLYVIGEASGIYSAYRPGGSALNSTQVGALRCAEKIAFSAGNKTVVYPEINTDEFSGFETDDESFLLSKWQNINSKLCGITRTISEMQAMLPEIENDIKICRNYKALEMLRASYVLYKSCIFAGETIGSYGSAVYENSKVSDENKNKILVYSKGECRLEDPTPIPESCRWFEKVFSRTDKKE